MQAIRVHLIGPTNYRGTRYKATAKAGSITIRSDYRINEDSNARKACDALRAKLGWVAEEGKSYGYAWACGTLPDGSYVFVNPHW
jgi:hypothetical protein